MFEHRQDLLRERQQQRLVVRLHQQRFSHVRRIAGELGSLFIALGMCLNQLEPGSESFGV